MGTQRKLRSSRVALSAAFLGLVATGTGACALPFDDSDDVAYCTDASAIIVDDSNCGDDDRSHYVRHGKYPRGLKPGTKVPAGGSWFRANDTTARSKLSLGSSFSNGSTVKSGTVGGGGTTHTSSGS